MLTNEKNHKRKEIICTECNHNYLLIDNHRQETYCPQCGLIHTDTTLPSITQEIQVKLDEIKFIRSLWRKKIK